MARYDVKKSTVQISSYLTPPGCLDDYLPPFGVGDSVPIATFYEHRFAFYYWLKWGAKNNSSIPALVTFDWHQDLCPPYEDKINELRNLDAEDLGQVAFYTWAELEHTNDVQIYSALLLNKLSDVYVICRQNTDRKDCMTMKDFFGNTHRVFIFHSVEEFENALDDLRLSSLYLDIDLDYLTQGNPTSMGSPYSTSRYTYLNSKEISAIFSPVSKMMKWIFERVEGITIAQEPDFCGGLRKSNMLFRILEKTLFRGNLFSKDLNGRYSPEWRVPININRY